jgi:hypothetical protein
VARQQIPVLSRNGSSLPARLIDRLTVSLFGGLLPLGNQEICCEIAFQPPSRPINVPLADKQDVLVIELGEFLLRMPR